MLLPLALLSIAFLVAQVVAKQLQRYTLVPSSLQFLVLGIMAGPVLTPQAFGDVLRDLQPLASAALAIVGLQLGLRVGSAWSKAGALATTVSYGGLVLTFLVLSLGTLLWLLLDGAWSYSELLSVTLALAAAGLSSSGYALAALSTRRSLKGPLYETGRGLAPGLSAVAALVFTAAVLWGSAPAYLAHQLPELDGSGWLLVTIGLGAAAGLVCVTLSTPLSERRQRRFVALSVAALIGGIAHALSLSPLLVGVTAGLLMGRMTPKADAFNDTFEGLGPAAYALLLVFAGSYWLPASDWVPYAMAAAYVAFRPLSHSFAGAIALSIRDLKTAGSRRIGWTLLDQGPLAIAFFVDYVMIRGDLHAALLGSAIISGVLLNELWALRSARSVLEEACELGELHPDLSPEGKDG